MVEIGLCAHAALLNTSILKMRFPLLLIRTRIAILLSFLTFASAQSIPGATFFNGTGAPGAGPYQLVDNYEPSIFFNKFNFYSVGRSCMLAFEAC